MGLLVYTPSAPLTTLGTLVTRVQSLGHGSADVDHIKTWINMAYEDVVSRRRWGWLEAMADVSTNPNVEYFDLGTIGSPKLRKFGKLRPKDTATPEDLTHIHVADPAEYYTNRVVPSKLPTGKPERFWLWKNRVYWDPVPDSKYNFLLYYHAQPPAVESDADVLLVPDALVLVYGALMFSKIRSNDSQYRDYKAMYDEQLRLLAASDSQGEFQTSERVMLPSRYRRT